LNDVELAIAAAEAGSAVVRRCFGTTLTRFEKGARDFATNADIEAENAMLAVLRRERPDDTFVGEESGSSGANFSSRTWLIDPLCGTLNYAVGMRVAAVNVALRQDSRYVAAAVADPFNQELFWTDGRRACRRHGDRDVPLVPNAASQIVDLHFDPAARTTSTISVLTVAADLDFATRFSPRVVSSSLALAWVATGQRAAYVTNGDLRENVHFAAGLALCEAAGCKITDLQGQACGSGATGLIAAADAPTHSVLLALAKKHLV
jgi:myo-inositol-1(or 4)-monophosphatase